MITENSDDKRMAYHGKECYLSTRIYFTDKFGVNFMSDEICDNGAENTKLL